MGISSSGTENSLILKNKMAAAGISLKTFFYWLFLIGRRLNLFIGDMCNRYICPLQPCRHLTLKLLIQGHARSAEVTHIADFKSAYIPLLLVLEVCNVKPTYRKSCATNILMLSDLTLDPLLQGQTGIAKLKSAYNSLIIGPRGLEC